MIIILLISILIAIYGLCVRIDFLRSRIEKLEG